MSGLVLTRRGWQTSRSVVLMSPGKGRDFSLLTCTKTGGWKDYAARDSQSASAPRQVVCALSSVCATAWPVLTLCPNLVLTPSDDGPVWPGAGARRPRVKCSFGRPELLHLAFVVS